MVIDWLSETALFPRTLLSSNEIVDVLMDEWRLCQGSSRVEPRRDSERTMREGNDGDYADTSS
jgi:hypothetical protein